MFILFEMEKLFVYEKLNDIGNGVMYQIWRYGCNRL
jgi:hypothetical protein